MTEQILKEILAAESLIEKRAENAQKKATKMVHTAEQDIRNTIEKKKQELAEQHKVALHELKKKIDEQKKKKLADARKAVDTLRKKAEASRIKAVDVVYDEFLKAIKNA